MIDSFIKDAKVLDIWDNKEKNKVKIPTEDCTSNQFPWCGAGRNLELIYILKMK